jgi:hypothetical protein
MTSQTRNMFVYVSGNSDTRLRRIRNVDGGRVPSSTARLSNALQSSTRSDVLPVSAMFGFGHSSVDIEIFFYPQTSRSM